MFDDDVQVDALPSSDDDDPMVARRTAAKVKARVPAAEIQATQVKATAVRDNTIKSSEHREVLADLPAQGRVRDPPKSRRQKKHDLEV